MKEFDIDYISDDVVETYAKELTKIKTLQDLLSTVTEWDWCADDALAIVSAMNEEDFNVFKTGLKKERSGEFSGEEWTEKYSCILMPTKMFKAAMVAEKFNCPFGTAWIRLKEHVK